MSDLVAFLRARLDEDAGVPAMVQEVEYHLNSNPPKAIRDALSRRMSPSALLREVEAKRRIIDLDGDWPYGAEMETGEAVTGWSNAIDRVLRLLALSYSDHPDYREEWRPSGTSA